MIVSSTRYNQEWASAYLRPLLPGSEALASAPLMLVHCLDGALIIRLILTIQLVVTTGSISRGQGLTKYKTMTRTYWEFHVHGE